MPTMQYGTLKIAGFGKTHKKCCENNHTLNLLLFVPRSLVPNDVAAKLQEVEKIPPAGGRVSSSPRLTLRWCCCAATSCAVSCAGTGAPAASGSATGSSWTGARTSPARTASFLRALTGEEADTKATKSFTRSTSSSERWKWKTR